MLERMEAKTRTTERHCFRLETIKKYYLRNVRRRHDMPRLITSTIIMDVAWCRLYHLHLSYSVGIVKCNTQIRYIIGMRLWCVWELWRSEDVCFVEQSARNTAYARTYGVAYRLATRWHDIAYWHNVEIQRIQFIHRIGMKDELNYKILCAESAFTQSDVTNECTHLV